MLFQWSVLKFQLVVVVQQVPLSQHVEDLFKDSPSVTPSLTPEKPQKDLKNDIMSLFEKVCASASIGLFKAELLL